MTYAQDDEIITNLVHILVQLTKKNEYVQAFIIFT